jgi:hypothetical protein
VFPPCYCCLLQSSHSQLDRLKHMQAEYVKRVKDKVKDEVRPA